SWTPLKFYRAARFNQQSATLSFDAGEYSALLGRSYAEIAGESRSQHKSQGFGVLQRKGPVPDYLRREASRVNESTPATGETSLFDGIDTTWERFRSNVANAGARTALETFPMMFANARAAFDPFDPRKLVRPLAGISRAFSTISESSGLRPVPSSADLMTSLTTAQERTQSALRAATGVSVEATAERETYPVGGLARIFVALYNRGRDTLGVSLPVVLEFRTRPRLDLLRSRVVPPGGVVRDTLTAHIDSISQPWWLRPERRGDMFAFPASAVADKSRDV